MSQFLDVIPCVGRIRIAPGVIAHLNRSAEGQPKTQLSKATRLHLTRPVLDLRSGRV
jgi:hypothetical protein